jgi:hypothetical protein
LRSARSLICHHRGAQALGRPGWKKQRIIPAYSPT